MISTTTATTTTIQSSPSKNTGRPEHPSPRNAPTSKGSKLNDFFWTYTEEPHRTRRQAIIKAHPEVRLFIHLSFTSSTSSIILIISGPKTMRSRTAHQIRRAGCSGTSNHARLFISRDIDPIMAVFGDGLHRRRDGESEFVSRHS